MYVLHTRQSSRLCKVSPLSYGKINDLGWLVHGDFLVSLRPLYRPRPYHSYIRIKVKKSVLYKCVIMREYQSSH